MDPRAVIGCENMKIVVGYVKSPEGQAALDRAIEEARLRDATLIVVHSMKGGSRDEAREAVRYREELESIRERLRSEGVAHDVREFVRGNTVSEDLVELCEKEQAELVVIGLRRRSPVGKLVLGSNAQDILLHVDCPVLCVKSAE